jgi:hypothetical protein
MANHGNQAAKSAPNGVDIFLVMVETLEVNNWEEASRAVFVHGEAQSRFAASVF